MIRFCPNCETEREAHELICEGELNGTPCGWNLADLPLRPAGWRPADQPAPPLPAQATCPSGHPVSPGDLLCPTCGADLSELSEPVLIDEEPAAPAPTGIGDWLAERRLAPANAVSERYTVLRARDQVRGEMTLYNPGKEPDPAIHEVLRRLPRDFIPELLDTGRWEGRAFEVFEQIDGGTLADIRVLQSDLPLLSALVRELGAALNAFADHGLRHRDLTPGAIHVRSRDPLDLVITDFGSAKLSEFDLDIVSPLETNRYTAPEAIAGGVAAASDWWSLGMMLLEQVTGGACFEGVNDQTFLIHVVASGAPIPDGLPEPVEALLRGLLAVDRRQRWGWPKIQRWLNGDIPEVPSPHRAPEVQARQSISIGGKPYVAPSGFALAACSAQNWSEARELLAGGAILTWARETSLEPKTVSELGRVSALEGVSDDFRLSLALKVLNSAIPLACRGEIITPGWLLDNPAEGYELISGPVPDILEAWDAEHWLVRLKARASLVRDRARRLEVALSEDELQVHLLSTSRARLSALWAERRRILPDTDHPGLMAIIERHLSSDEDLILLLSADIAQFRTTEAIIAEATELAARAGLEPFGSGDVEPWIGRSRRELHAEIDRRLEGFARCGLERVDEWADQFRLERRLPIGRALVLLAVPAERWEEPPRQTYLANLLDFFSARLSRAAHRGPLTRMVIGRSAARLDICELGSSRVPATVLLEHLLVRNDQTVALDQRLLASDPSIEVRVRKLHGHASLYRRDTGIDGLFLGFPFLIKQDANPATRTRIAPVLLWPLRIIPEVGGRGRISIGFDRDREEVRLNPAFSTLLGPDTAELWKRAADDLLRRSSISAIEAVESFAHLANSVPDRSLSRLPGKDAEAEPGGQLACSAVLFHLAYIGQSVMQDLRDLRRRPAGGTSLGTALKIEEPTGDVPTRPPDEIERYFTAASDPSQEAAVLEARYANGLLIEGPPGTGKSQTIVNLVGDAIGRRRNLLIVCQKQAALDVVYKRLAAEGLRDRVIMITDMNKDRLPVIRSVREQLQKLPQTAQDQARLRPQRHQIAARIEALERELDLHYEATYASNGPSGLSYRQIMADLIGFDTPERPAISSRELRRLLADADVGEVANLQETCGPLARLWLSARYESSPLAVLKTFAGDRDALDSFREDLDAFVRAEQDRAAVIDRTPRAFPIDDSRPFREWHRRYPDHLLGATEASRTRLARWLPLLIDKDAVRQEPANLASLSILIDALASLAPPPDDHLAVEVCALLPDHDLTATKDLAEELAAPRGFFGRLSPARWAKSRRYRKFLTGNRLAPTAPLRQVLQYECAIRPLRRELTRLTQALGEPRDPLELLAPESLANKARALRTELVQSHETARRLGENPRPQDAFAMARMAREEAVRDFLDAQRQSCDRHEANARSLAALERLETWFSADWISERRSAIRSNGPSWWPAQEFSDALPTLAAYQRFRTRAAELSPMVLRTFAALRSVAGELAGLPAEQLEAEVRRMIGRDARLAWKARLENGHPVLASDESELRSKVRSLAAADEQMRVLNRRALIEDMDLSSIRPARDWDGITRLAGTRTRRLREFVEEGIDLGLMTLRPVWLMNPDVASRVLPMRPALFETVVYDEASQIPIEYALPSLFRSRRVVVSGDEKQMPPTSFFTSKVENDEADISGEDDDEAGELRNEAVESWNRREIKDCPDLLQLAKTVLPTRTLQIHYRSAYRELIQFSNAAFYGSKLSVPVRHPEGEIRRSRPIEVIHAGGEYVDQTNLGEAGKVVELLQELWKSPRSDRRSIGVVTFNRKQADAIEEVLEDRAEADTAFRAALAEERERYEDGEDMSFFVKNVENVQGDERDIIIFSSTFGRNATGVFRRNFGVLGQTGGERRLNVAVTRARRQVILVTSMPIGEISDLLNTRRPASNAREFLHAYMEYARTISSGEAENTAALIRRLQSHPDADRPQEVELDPFQQAVRDFVQQLGLRAHPVTDAGAFCLDLAVEDGGAGAYALGIECDAPRHPLLSKGRGREMWRPSVLERVYRRIHRISSKDWFEDCGREKQRLREVLELGALQGAAE